MKVYLAPDAWLGKGIRRVAEALASYRPSGVEIVPSRDQADFEIAHIVGWGTVPAGLGEDRPYAAVQYCWQTTEDPSLARWRSEVWNEARAVWSYYDLPTEKLYLAPLGVDSKVFFPNGNAKRYRVGSSGYVAASECVGEVHEALRRVGGEHAHLGPVLGITGVVYRNGISDAEVAALWRSCERVSALRRGEGFELPGFEALLCGTRPIVFATPVYRRWYGEHAEYVPEVEPLELVNHLAEVLAKDPRPVSEDERQEIRAAHDWQKLASGFWERALA